MFFVYILKSDKDYIYIGQTKDLEDRLIRHNSNRSKYTKNKGPFRIIYKEVFKTRTEAMKREKELKSGKDREWLKNNVI